MSDIQTINYEPLHDMSHAFGKVFKTTLHGIGLALNIVVLVLCIVLAELQLLPVVAWLAILYMMFIGSRVSKYRNNVWTTFGAVNGWSIDVASPETVLLPPSLQYGRSHSFSSVLEASLGPINAELFTYQCVTSVGRNEQTHVFTVAKVPLPVQLPHILLVAKSGHPDLREVMVDQEKLTLEGDFDQYFTLSLEKGHEVDVLAILTPDVMQTLIQYNQKEDIEIIGANAYFISRNDKRDYTDTEQLIQSVVELTGKITQNLSQANVLKPVPPLVSTESPALSSAPLPAAVVVPVLTDVPTTGPNELSPRA